MRRAGLLLLTGALSVAGPAFAQPPDVNTILAAARAALGGEKRLAAVKTFAATGQSTRVVNEQSTAPTDAELAIELPDRFMKKDVLAMLGSAAITRASGFSGDAVINVIDQPPMPSGAVVVFRAGPGGGGGGEIVTSEQKDAAQKAQLLANKQEFARLALGLFAASPAAYPLQFAYGGRAESPDGQADIVDVTGEGGFACRLFVDTVTHLPLMLSWMAREPLILTQTVGGGAPNATIGHAPAAAGANVLSVQAQGKPLTPEDRDKLMAELEEQRQKAEAARRVVEYRLYYGDYREVNGVKVPFRLQRSIDGQPAEELTLDNVKINGKIDPRTFDVK